MRVLLLSAALLSTPACAGTFQSFDLPGATSTCGTAIASDGTIAGVSAVQQNGTVALNRPFLRIGTHFLQPKTAIPAQSVYLTGVNRWRTVVGQYQPVGQLAFDGFKYHGGALTLLPLGVPAAINDRGLILTQSQRVPAVPLHFNQVLSLQTKAGALTTIDDGTGTMVAGGMDAAGDRVVGRSIGTTGWQAWSYFQGSFTPIVVPQATLLTLPTGIDASGRVSGSYAAGTWTSPVLHGFILANNTAVTWDAPAPGVTATQIMGSNEAGQITGCFTDATGVHGFLATP